LVALPLLLLTACGGDDALSDAAYFDALEGFIAEDADAARHSEGSLTK
jgi:hypothetical protein